MPYAQEVDFRMPEHYQDLWRWLLKGGWATALLSPTTTVTNTHPHFNESTSLFGQIIPFEQGVCVRGGGPRLNPLSIILSQTASGSIAVSMKGTSGNRSTWAAQKTSLELLSKLKNCSENADSSIWHDEPCFHRSSWELDTTSFKSLSISYSILP